MEPVRSFSRRAMLAAPFAAGLVVAAKSKLRIGVTDWNLGRGANPEAVAFATSLGFEGVEVSFGRQVAADRLPLDNPDLIARYRKAFQENKIAIAGTCVDRLHVNCLMNDPLAQKWVLDGIRLTRELGAKVMLMPFFGNCALGSRELMDSTAAALKGPVREAEKAGVTLGLENTISAEDSVRIMEKVGSPNLKVYCDPGNSFRAGHDPYKEIPWLGAARICQIHIKDNPYLGEGKLDWVRLMDLILNLGFEGFANLETGSPSKDVAADMRRNLAYVRRLVEGKA